MTTFSWGVLTLFGAAVGIATLLTHAASAETVAVRYAGNVDLSGYDCEPTKPSSFVNRICYDEGEGHLVVLLRDAYYQYCDMPAEVVDQWREAESLGRFYNQNVKGSIYGCN